MNINHIVRPFLIIFLFCFSDTYGLEHLARYKEKINSCESEVLANCLPELPFHDRIASTTQLEHHVRNNVMFDQSCGHETDWSHASVARMVSGLIWIQNKKLQLRDTTIAGSRYRTNWDQNLMDKLKSAPRTRGDAIRNVDTYPVKFILNNEVHTLISHFNGRSPQPGNCLVMRTHIVQPDNARVVNFNVMDYWDNYRNPNPITVPLYDTQPYKLMRAIEICRRKAVNPTTNASDPFAELPVTLGVVMVSSLIQHNHAHLKQFWIAKNPYHIFTGDDRIDYFKALLNKYRQINGIAVDLDAVMSQIEHDA